ncbi:SNF2 family N-terminal domain-containing protein [Xylaria venustula]|nr:SNF2 family N-terminal domain-containing protein [Xylaria venustula]
MAAPPAKRQKSSHIRSNEREKIAYEFDSPLDHTRVYDSERLIYGVANHGNISAPMTEESELTCFGTICLTPDSVEAFTKEEAAPVEVNVSERRLLSRRSGRHVATLSARDAEIIDLFTQEGVETEIILAPVPSDPESKLPLLPRIMVTLFRTQRLEEVWMDFFQGQMLYLQDPIYTKRDVPYWNPQRFHNEANAYTSAFWQRLEADQSRQEEISPTDFLAAFTSDGILTETEGSVFLRTPLQIHQKRALTFMVNREQGWNLEENRTDIWSLKWDPESQDRYFVNNVDLTECSEPPPPFKGGILADAMGCGKTLSMISLIAHDRSNGLQGTTRSSRIFPSRCTLVIMPPHLLKTWDKELSKHLSNEHFTWKCHHGSTKMKNESEIASTDIVLITYSTLAREWRHASSSTIYRHSWHRVILDEAHSIKDSAAITAKAAFGLKSDRRWVVTGTPIQNRVSELASLFRFLQVSPYSNPKIFDERITRLWSSGKEQQAIERLKCLLNFIMLRRSQDGLNLPGRTDLKVIVNFDDQERNVYNAARDKSMRSIDDLLSHQSSESYLNALQKINSLRLICNLGISVASTIDDSNVTTQPFSRPEKMIWDELWAPQPSVNGSFPTKIRHLIHDLEQHSSDEKCIIFSSWTTTLELVFTALKQARISCVQVDGRVKPKQREKTFHDFTHVESIRVLLLSLSCGSSGLTLTAASRVYLMEPQWNPSTEEQALGRVYRIGQTRDVTTIRYTMDNSIEKHIIAIQDGKRDLVTVLLSSPSSTSRMTKQQLIELKELL